MGDVFISYAHEDAGKRTELANRLRRYLELEGFEVFLDKPEIAAGTPWEKEIEEALQKSADVVLALLTSASSAPEIISRVKDASAGALPKSQHGRHTRRSRLALSWVESNLPEDDIAEISDLALSVFEDKDVAEEWLKEQNLATDNRPPISLLGTPEGFNRVKTLLQRIDYGVLT